LAERPAPAQDGGKGHLKKRAYTDLKRLLVSGSLVPGSFQSERQLAKQLGMSNTPVRAALERLEAEGYIAISPQQGIVVRELSVHEIADQYEIRAALESYTVRTIAGNLTADQVARVRSNLRAQEALRGSGDLLRGVEMDAEFHTQFAEFLGNGEILRVVTQLREKMQRVVTQVFRLSPARVETGYEEHSAIAAAVIVGDGPHAAELIVRHLEMGKQLILSPRR